MRVTQFEEKGMPCLKITGHGQLDVKKTFDCGQCFRFEPVEGTRHQSEYAGIAFGRHVSFASEGEELYIYNSTEREFYDIWSRFLALDLDYADIDRSIASHCPDGIMREAMECGRGIRILRQDAFEAVISFIISQNNNIPRIKKIIEALSLRCGEPVAMNEGAVMHSSGLSSLCAFPSCEAILSLGESGLSELKVGFRAKYINDAVTKLSRGELALSEISAMERTEDCISALCSVKGIGLKVASCAAPFGMGRYDAFPVDVWMKRVGEKYFGNDPASFSAERFGEFAGIAQQYLFYYERYNSSES